ncbi:MAG: hypothetical protein H0U52_07130 [Chloroflexi bacterium]|nr:hypothetical protein [Chloroflexota bacterium]
MSPKSRSFDATHSAVAFPLGGIGTGNVSLGARGDLRDWEIFNRPAKGSRLPNTFFAVRAQTGDDPPIARVLEGPIAPPHDLSHGYHPWAAAGLPRLDGTRFVGEYPFARIEFVDRELPVRVELEAFTPLIPLDPEDSGLPAAVFTWRATNVSSEPVALTIVGSLINPVGGIGFDPFGNIAAGGTGLNVNELRADDGLHGLFLHGHQHGPDDLRFGDLSLATLHPDVTIKRAWLRGAWYDFLREFWDDLTDDGRLEDLGYDTPSPMGSTDTGSLGLMDRLEPGETRDYRFLLTWFFPIRTNSWENDPQAPLVRNHYATRFGSSWDVARYLAAEMPRLERATRQFHASLFTSTLSPDVIDAVSANIVPIRSPTCFWLEDGRFFGFEGCFDNAGCCEGTCTHVWSYAHTAAYLFPSLEREMRRIEFAIETEPDGYMAFRTHKTFGTTFTWPWADQAPEAAVDGQMGSILRAYREWRLSGDRDWLATIWPGVKRAMAFAGTHWDLDGDHVLDGRQHTTYDIEFHGPNPLCGIYYLAALRAVERLAKVMGEPDVAGRVEAAFAAGSRRLDALLWNGEFYVQRLDDVDAVKYQHGEGCLSDQLLGQLHARMLDLGDLLPVEHVRGGIKAVFDHNFRRDFRDHVNCQRTYVLNDESGLVLCTWPNGGQPRFPFVYSDEVWTGIEYQVAAHLIYEGWLDQGLEVVAAVRARHDGHRRNPWDEVECGHHYARSMSSWAVLLALSGFHSDADAGDIAFAARIHEEDFRSFFSSGVAWGRFEQHLGPQPSVTLTVDGGSLPMRRLRLGREMSGGPIEATVDGAVVPIRLEPGSSSSIVFDEQLLIQAGQRLTISV